MAEPAGIDPRALAESLKLGSATSSALTLFDTMVTPATVEHLSSVEAEDMAIFSTAMRDAAIDVEQVFERGLAGARRMSEVVQRLNP